MHHRWLRWRDWWVVMSRNESQASLKHVLMNHMPTYANVSLLSKECSVGYFKNNGIFIDASRRKTDAPVRLNRYKILVFENGCSIGYTLHTGNFIDATATILVAPVRLFRSNLPVIWNGCSGRYFTHTGNFIDATQCKSDGLAVFGRTVYPPCFLIQHRPQIMWGVRSVAFSGIRESMVVGPNACLSSTWWISKWIKNTKSVKIVWWCEE